MTGSSPNSTAGTPASRKQIASEAPSRPTLITSPCAERDTASRSARTNGFVRATDTVGQMNVRVTSIDAISSTCLKISSGS